MYKLIELVYGKCVDKSDDIQMMYDRRDSLQLAALASGKDLYEVRYGVRVQ